MPQIRLPECYTQLNEFEIEYSYGGKLSGGEIAVITVGCIIGATLIGFGCYLGIRKLRGSTSNNGNVPTQPNRDFSEWLPGDYNTLLGGRGRRNIFDGVEKPNKEYAIDYGKRPVVFPEV